MLSVFVATVLLNIRMPIAALLGASPGASTGVHVMLEVLNKCFPQHMKEWEPKIKEMVPSYGKSLMENPELLNDVHFSAAQAFGFSENTQTAVDASDAQKGPTKVNEQIDDGMLE